MNAFSKVLPTDAFPQLKSGLKQEGLTDFSLTWRSDRSGIIFQRQKQQVVKKEGEHFSLKKLNFNIFQL